MNTDYVIQFEWPSGVVYATDIEGSGMVFIENLPIPLNLQLQLQGLSRMFDQGMSKFIEEDIYPTKEQKIVFKRLYERVIPALKAALPPDWTLNQEIFPTIFLLDD